jgi:thioredoxin reductase (NADPH)
MSFLLLIEIDMVETDVLIVGSGPVGIFGAFQAGMLGMKSYIVDCLDFVGGQCVALYPEKPIHDIPSYKSINAKDLIDNLVDQASQFNPVYHLSDTVEKINGNAGNFEILTKNGKNIRAKSIIIAAGSGVFGPNKPPLENIEKYENKSIFYCSTTFSVRVLSMSRRTMFVTMMGFFTTSMVSLATFVFFCIFRMC